MNFASRTNSKTLAIQCIRCRVDAAVWEGGRWGCGTVEEVADQGDGIGEVDEAVVISIGAVDATEGRRGR